MLKGSPVHDPFLSVVVLSPAFICVQTCAVGIRLPITWEPLEARALPCCRCDASTWPMHLHAGGALVDQPAGVTGRSMMLVDSGYSTCPEEGTISVGHPEA